MQEQVEEVVNFDQLVFGDKSTFHISGKVNRHTVWICGIENSRATVEYLSDSLSLVRIGLQ